MTYPFKQNHKDERNLKNVHLEAVETRKYDLDAPSNYYRQIRSSEIRENFIIENDR